YMRLNFHSKRYLLSFPTRRSSDLVPNPLIKWSCFIVEEPLHDESLVPFTTAVLAAQLERPLLAFLNQLRNLQVHHFYSLGNCSRSEEHTSELQSQPNLVCRLLLET